MVAAFPANNWQYFHKFFFRIGFAKDIDDPYFFIWRIYWRHLGRYHITLQLRCYWSRYFFHTSIFLHYPSRIFQWYHGWMYHHWLRLQLLLLVLLLSLVVFVLLLLIVSISSTCRMSICHTWTIQSAVVCQTWGNIVNILVYNYCSPNLVICP